MAEAPDAQQGEVDRWRVAARIQSDQEERGRREAEAAVPRQRPATAQTSGLHRDGPDLAAERRFRVGMEQKQIN